MSGFLAMGGYAVWVWSSYAVAAAVLAALGIHAALRARSRRAALEALEQRLGPASDRRRRRSRP